MKLILQMAWRNIWRNKLRSIVILLSVTLGLVCGIFVLALYDGMMHSRVRIVIDSEIGHLQIHDPRFNPDQDVSFYLKDTIQLIHQLKSDARIKSFSKRSVAQGMIATATGSAGVQIFGINETEEKNVSQIAKKIIEGNIDSMKSNEIIIGKKLSQKLKLHLGKKLVLTFTDKQSNIVSAGFRVGAIYETVNTPLDEKIVYTRSSDLNEQLGIENNFHELVMLLKNDEDIETIKSEYKKLFPGLSIESWKDLSPETNLMVDTLDIYAYIIVIIILFALSFGIVNTMLMAILERTREIAMMCALGLNKIKLFSLVMAETIFLTFLGAPIGILLSLLLVTIFHHYGIDFSESGKDMMKSFGFESVIYPEYPKDKIIPIIMIVISVAILSCIFPALKALKLQPSEGLRK